MTEPAEDRLVTPLFLLITFSGLAYFVAIGSLLPVLPRYVENNLDGSGLEVGLVIGAFVEDQDPTNVEDTIPDYFPNATAYGPFISLPSRTRSGGESPATGG
ncbi:MAG TPA: hypothetical protein VIT01_17270, partial [Acidimicrobiales bacterium]